MTAGEANDRMSAKAKMTVPPQPIQSRLTACGRPLGVCRKAKYPVPPDLFQSRFGGGVGQAGRAERPINVCRHRFLKGVRS
jgi:hypothetical protein